MSIFHSTSRVLLTSVIMASLASLTSVADATGLRVFARPAATTTYLNVALVSVNAASLAPCRIDQIRAVRCGQRALILAQRRVCCRDTRLTLIHARRSMNRFLVRCDPCELTAARRAIVSVMHCGCAATAEPAFGVVQPGVTPHLPAPALPTVVPQPSAPVRPQAPVPPPTPTPPQEVLPEPTFTPPSIPRASYLPGFARGRMVDVEGFDLYRGFNSCGLDSFGQLTCGGF